MTYSDKLASSSSVRPVRRLVALMFTDMVGYSSLASRDEKLAFELLEEHRVLFRKIFPLYGGIENKTVGDAFFIEFGSAVEAVHCAIDLQTKLYERQVFVSKERQLKVRIGLHLGDIIDFEGDSYGDGVNIAARVEGKAESGGVVITQQVYDQVMQDVAYPIKKVGTFELKNIAKPTALYKIVFPWEETSNHHQTSVWFRLRRKFDSITFFKDEGWRRNGFTLVRGLVLGGLLVFSMGVIGFGIHKGSLRGGLDRSVDSALQGSVSTVDLSSGWSYALKEKFTSPDDSNIRWETFDVHRPHYYSDRIQGDYWLKKEFKLVDNFIHPSIVLGLIASQHRVYLNGVFIGGANDFVTVQNYTFDSRVLRPNEVNQIVVWANTPPVLNPGLNALPSVGTYLSEFEEMQPKLNWERATYGIVRSLYLAFGMLVMFLCAMYYFTDRSKFQFLYFASYLALGGLVLVYFNSTLNQAFDPTFRRFIKAFALSISSFVLLSCYLHLRKRPQYESLNNFLGGAVGLALGVMILKSTDGKQMFAYYNAGFSGILGYTAFWWLGAVADYMGLWRGRFKGEKVSYSQLMELGLIIVFGVITGMMLYVGSYSAVMLNPEFRIRVQDMGTMYPFLFAVVAFIAGVIDYFEKTKSLQYSMKKDNLILGIVNLIRDARNIHEAVRGIQDRVNRFIEAERSTIFLVSQHEDSKDFILKASYFYGGLESRHHLEKRIQPREGLIGYALSTRAPLLVKSVSQDLRFRQHVKNREREYRYKTDSCLVFPLLVQQELIGVLTVADKKTGRPFSKEDFQVMYAVSKDIGLLLSNTLLQEQVSQFLEKKAA